MHNNDINAAIAEKIFKAKNVRKETHYPANKLTIAIQSWQNAAGEDCGLPDFCKDLKAAMMIVEALSDFREGKPSYQFDLSVMPYTNSWGPGHGYKAKFSFGGGSFSETASTAEMAICLAALKVVDNEQA